MPYLIHVFLSQKSITEPCLVGLIEYHVTIPEAKLINCDICHVANCLRHLWVSISRQGGANNLSPLVSYSTQP